jgi:hypothetical protein
VDALIILTGKALLVLIALVTAYVFFIIFASSSRWQKELMALESECDIARDEVVVQATLMRSQLAEVHDKLTSKHEKSEIEAVGKLVTQAIPVVQLLLSREKSLFAWGMAGLNLVRGAMKCFSASKNN